MIKRLIVFFSLFIVTTGIIGSWIVPTRLLYGYDFYIYGNLGKMVILSTIMFALLAKDKLKTISTPKWSTYNIIFLFLSIILIPIFFWVADELLNKNLGNYFPAHIILVTIPLLQMLGIFGINFIIGFGQRFYREILICFGLSIVFDFAIFKVWKLWPYFSQGVLQSVKFLLSLTFANVEHIQPLTLRVNDFKVAIQEACSGLDSLFMFSALYALIGFVDRSKINFQKYVLAYIPSILGMYLINIIRVYLLILIGVLLSPELALRLFHTYAGMILFILYFGILMKVGYKKILKMKLPGKIV